jgi:hypothetical protein
MTAPLTGGCTCGAVRYECTAEPVMAFNCHCRDCQRATGGAYVPAVVVPRNALRVTGEVKYFAYAGEVVSFSTEAFAQTAVRDYLVSQTLSQNSW